MIKCFCYIQPSLHRQWQWADKMDVTRDQGEGRPGGLHGLNGQEEENQFPVRPGEQQKQQWLCSHSFLQAVVFLAAGSTKPDKSYSNTTLGPRAEYKPLRSQTNGLTIMPFFLSKVTGLAILKKKKSRLYKTINIEHYSKVFTLSMTT